MKTQDGGTMTLQFLASMDLQKSRANQSPVSSPIPCCILSDFPLGGLHLRSDHCCPYFGNQAVTRRMMDLDAQVRLRVDSKDEIGDLKEQINSLTSIF